MLYEKWPIGVLFVRFLLVYVRDKALKRGKALGIACVDACILQNTLEGLTDFSLKDLLYVLGRKGVIVTEALKPCRVLFDALVVGKILACQNRVAHNGDLLLETCGENGKSHDLDQADVFFLDVMYVGMWVINAERMLLGRDVVAEHEIKLEFAVAHTGDRGDRVVRLTVSLGKDEGVSVRIAAPSRENAVSKLDERCFFICAQTNDRHRPLDNASLDVLKATEGDGLFDRCLGHCKGVMTALHVVMREDRTADDGKIGIRAEEIVRELLNEIKLTDEGVAVDLHRHVLTGENDAVLVIIYVGRVLHEPLCTGKPCGNQAKRLTGGTAGIACITLILGAEQALWISALRQQLCGCNRTGILFGLGEVDGDVDRAVVSVGRPLHVLCHAIGTNVVAVAAELVKIVGRFHGRDLTPTGFGFAGSTLRFASLIFGASCVSHQTTDFLCLQSE